MTSLSHIHTFGPHWTNELRGGFFELFNTRISKFRDIFNSTLGINNPLEQAVGGLASLMPTVDIVTQKSGAGIGNAWDFFDRQRNAYATDLVTSVRGSHSLQFGGEARRTNLKGEYMARTNGDLDYDNWILFFTGHGASGGGSDLDQGDTRRDYNMFDVGLFAQDEWRVRKGLTLTLGARWDYYGWPVETAGRIGTYYNQADAARAGIEPGYYIAKDHLIFKPGFNPLQMGLAVSPYVEPLNLSQVHKAQRDNIFEPDRNNIAPRLGFAWKPGFSERLVLRGGYGIYFERPSGSFKTDLQLSSPFFIYQNVPAPLDMANPYPHLNINPFTIPLQVQISRDASGTPTWRRFDGTAFPATEPFAAKNFTFIDPFVKTPYVQQWTFNVQFEPVRGNLLDVRYVGTRGVGLMAKVNLAQPLDPRVTPVNGFTDIRTRTGALINPDFFVPAEYVGLGRQSGYRVRSNWGASTYHGLQANYRRRFQRRLLVNAAYTWSKTLDNISSDGGQVEHDARNSRNNRGPADFDRAHRFNVAYVYELPTPFGQWRAAKMLLGGWSLSGMAIVQSGTRFSIIGSSTSNAYFAQVARVRVDFAPGPHHRQHQQRRQRAEPPGSVLRSHRVRQFRRPLGQLGTQHSTRALAKAGRFRSRQSPAPEREIHRRTTLGSVQRLQPGHLHQPELDAARRRRWHHGSDHLHRRWTANHAGGPALEVLNSVGQALSPANYPPNKSFNAPPSSGKRNLNPAASGAAGSTRWLASRTSDISPNNSFRANAGTGKSAGR